MYLGRIVEHAPTSASSSPRRAIRTRRRCCRRFPVPEPALRRERVAARGRRAEPDRSAVGLPLPHALPARAAALRRRKRRRSSSTRRTASPCHFWRTIAAPGVARTGRRRAAAESRDSSGCRQRFAPSRRNRRSDCASSAILTRPGATRTRFADRTTETRSPRPPTLRASLGRARSSPPRSPPPPPRRRCASASPRIPTCSIRRSRARSSAASCSRRSATSCSTSTRSSRSSRSSRPATSGRPTARR